MATLREHWWKIGIGVLLLVGVLAYWLLLDDALVLERPDGASLVVAEAWREGSYAAFLQDHAHVRPGTQAVEVDILNPSHGHGYRVLSGFEGEANVLYTDEDSYTRFDVNVPADGMYNIFVEYFPVEGRGIDIARELRVNGEVPFMGAEHIIFSRVWGDSPIGVRVDNRGNQVRPPQIEHPRWSQSAVRDRLGFQVEPYRFFFAAGTNSLSLMGINEPMVIRRISIVPVAGVPTFAEYAARNNVNRGRRDFSLRIQGEDSVVRSSPSLFPLFDASSGATDPPSASLITLNMIGGEPWRMPGQWIEWEFEVPEDGYYRISISARQSYNRGFVSSRSISINGEIPFAEVAAVPFQFNNKWELITLTDDLGNDILFPMRAGTNTIRMEVTLGDLGQVVDRMLASVFRLNEIYRTILVLTGPNPDSLRDYRVEYRLPEVMDKIYDEIALLYDIHEDLVRVAGGRNEQSGLISTMVRQLQTFHSRPHRIPIQFANFRANISALGDATRVLSEGRLDVDFIVVSGPDAELPVIREGFFRQTAHEIGAFAASFYMDFDSLGDVHTGNQTIDVWIPTGRDQATILKAMIDDSFVLNHDDDSFVLNHDIGVNLRLVQPAAVLPAVVAGIGPDVLLSMGMPDPVNYAMRNASADLSGFPDFHEVTQRFHPSAMVPFRFLDGYYALPETQSFSLMFYRTDVLEGLGIDPPQTWTDVVRIIPMLQRHNMEVGIPLMGDPLAPNLLGFLSMLYQRDGFLYNDEWSRAILDSEEAVYAFDMYTRFFTQLGSPRIFNFINRFRSGEMPIGFEDFGTFNMLSVFAPEIQGLWSFGLMPGTLREDGTVNHSVPAGGAAVIMLEQSERKDLAWEFMKWWTSAETQLRFGREMESIMGAAARYPTANLEAFSRLPWSTSQLEMITAQRNWVVGTPEVPGGYYVSRHIINATRRVINENVDTRETLLDFNIVINRELVNKRREFGLE